MPASQPPDTRARPPVARLTAACLLWGQGLVVLVLAGIVLPSAVAGSGGPAGRTGLVAALVLAATVGAAALVVGTGVRRSLRGARTAAVAVQVGLLVAAQQSHRPLLIALVAAIAVVTGAVLLSPALASTAPRHEARPDSTKAHGG